MQTAVEFYGVVDETDLGLIDRVHAFIRELDNKGHPNSNGDHLWSCHALCIATQAIFRPEGFRVVHGLFGAKNHSWLLREKIVGRHGVVTTDSVILDVYPVASCGGPILVDINGWSSPWRDLYVEARYRYKDTEVRGWHDDASTIMGMVKSHE